MSDGKIVVIALLGLAVVLSATGVVYAKYASRVHFAELETIRNKRDAMDVE